MGNPMILHPLWETYLRRNLTSSHPLGAKTTPTLVMVKTEDDPAGQQTPLGRTEDQEVDGGRKVKSVVTKTVAKKPYRNYYSLPKHPSKSRHNGSTSSSSTSRTRISRSRRRSPDCNSRDDKPSRGADEERKRRHRTQGRR